MAAMRPEEAGRGESGDPGPECVRAFETELEFVYRALRRHGVGASDAEDLAQEVFLILWRRWRELDRGRPLRPWLSGVAFKLAHQHRQREGRFVPGGLLDREDSHRPSDDQLSGAQARALVSRALSCLSDKHRAVLVMHDLDGLPMREIAAHLSVPLFTAYTRLRAGRRDLGAAIRRMQPSGARARWAVAPAALLRLAGQPDGPPAGLRDRVLDPSREPIEASARAVRAGRSAPPRLTGRSAWGTVAALGAFALLLALWRVRPPRPGRPPAPAGAASVEAGRRLSDGHVMTASVLPSRLPSFEAPALPSDPVALGRGLIGYWRFDEPPGAASTVVRDRSGTGNDCLVRSVDPDPLSGGAWIEGVVGGALALEGRRWLECPRVDRLAELRTELTIALWIKVPAGHPGKQVLVTRQLDLSGDRLFSLRLQASSVEFLSHVWKTLLRRPYASGGWTHVVATRDAGGTQVYLDGVPLGRNTRTEPGFIGGGKGALIVGGQVNGPEPGRARDLFRGSIDELMVYDRALSEAEVGALAAKVQPATGL
jgi:RNA polymerase sigma-70 factor (ECF subfamily)